MPNLNPETSKHNHKTLEKIKKTKEKETETKLKCPVKDKCLKKSVVYKATVTHIGKNMSYSG